MTNSPNSKFRKSRLIRQLQPYLLVILGGTLAILGQCSTSWSATNKFKYEAALTRRNEAMSFLDNFAKTNSERIYAASDYYWAVRSGAAPEMVAGKKKEFFEKRREAIIQEGIFISRGADYFGQEFKETLYKELFVAYGDLDPQVQAYELTKSDADGEKFEQLETKVNLLNGILLGIARRKLDEGYFQPPDMHD